MDYFIRSELLFGTEKVSQLHGKHVIIFGVGGVGGYVVEALARSGIGHLTIVDFDRVSESNINRQLCALTSTIGELKTDVFAHRVKDINPEIKLDVIATKIIKDDLSILDKEDYDYVVDAIDDVEAKVALLACCVQKGLPVISSMGAANHWDPTKIKIADIGKTEYCSLAKIVRGKLRQLGIKHGVKTIYTSEEVQPKHVVERLPSTKPGEKRPEGTVSYMPAIFGLYCASVVLRDLMGITY